MRKCMSWLVVCLLCAAPSLAQPRSSSAATAPAGPPLFEEVKETRFLFIPLTAEEARGAEGPLEFRVSFNGKPYVEETLSLEALQGTKEPSFELLATRPDLLDRLYDLSRDEGNQITVEIFLDGMSLRELSFAELLRNNRQLKAKPFHPVSAPSRVRDLSGNESPGPSGSPALMTAKGMQQDPACVNACTQAYYLCTGNDCFEDTDPQCIYCQEQYSNCLDSCPYVCVDPKSVREETRTVEVSSVSYGSTCYQDWWSNDPYWGSYYTYFNKTYRHTRVRITEYCNGSTSETTLSTWYSSQGCWEPSGYPCSWPNGKFNGWYC